MKTYKGLTWKEATKALRVYGTNKVEVKPPSITSIVASQLTSPLTLILITAVLISFITGNYLDGLIILLILIINNFFGFIQEYRSRVTFNGLTSLIKSQVYVLRDGEKILIDKSNLVPNDIIFLKLGDIVAADCFILEQNNLSVDESILNGETQTVFKVVNKDENRNSIDGILYSGTYITSGTCVAKVFATGKSSRFGQIVYLTKQNLKVSEYEQNLKNISKSFIYIGLIAFSLLFIANLLLKNSNDLISILLFATAIAVSIIPEALPLVAKLTLFKSAIKLSKLNIVVKHNSAIEDLGNINIICTDKTGTLTLDKLKVASFVSVINESDFFKYSYLSTVENSNPLDKSIFSFLNSKKVEDQSEFLIEEIPFNPTKKFSSRKFKNFEIIKGTPEYILKISHSNLKKYRDIITENSQKGLRAISLAVKTGDNITYIGTYFFYDQIRKEAKEVVEKAKNLGIDIKLITGDSKEVSEYVARKVGLLNKDETAILAEELDFNNPIILKEQVNKYHVFTRCSPEDKYKILHALEEDHYVGYIGDGINDAPSLAIANVGIVVDTATDIAKEESDILLLSNNIGVIVDGIIEGRKAFENLDKYLKNALAGNFGNFLTIGALSLFVNYLPMLPIQIFISNLITDIPLLYTAIDNVDRHNLRKPKNHSLKKTFTFALIFGLISSLFDIIYFLLIRNQPIDSIQTQLFALSIFTEIAVLFSLRSKLHFLSKSSSRPTKTLIYIATTAVLITTIISLNGIRGEFNGISIAALFTVIIVSLAYFLFSEVIKHPIHKLLKI